MPKSSRIKKYLVFASLIATLVVVILSVTAQSAEAGLLGSIADSVAAKVSISVIYGIINTLAYAALTVTGWLLAIAGALLNVSMYFTTHLGIFIDQSPAIYQVWMIIRDLSSILLIFVILYAAITMIIGQRQANYGEIIKNIIIVGVLINFSFFFTSVMIDASNIVSLQFYNAIAPLNTATKIDPADINNIPKIAASLMSSSGLSDIVMGTLKITPWWQKNTDDISTGNSQAGSLDGSPLNITLVSIGGIIVSTMTILILISIAAVALIRTAILIFLLAFSPIWIASYAIPQLKDLSKKWTKPFYAQLVFLPVYLAFLYVALRVVTVLNLNNIVNSGNGSTNLGNAINLFVGFSIVIVMLTVPMAAAVAVTSAVGGDSGLLEKVANGARGWVGRNTAGRLGYNTQQYLTKKFPVAANSLIGQSLIQNTAGKLANSGFGSATSRTASVTAAKARTQAQQAGRSLNSLRTAVNKGDHSTIAKIISGMSSSTIASLDKDLLKNDYVMEHLDDGAHKAIASNTNLSDKDKTEISTNRRNLLINSVSNYHMSGTRNAEIVKTMMDNISGSELAKLDDPNVANGQLTLATDDFVRHLKANQMKDMENVISQPTRAAIGTHINHWQTTFSTQHSAHGYYSKNAHMWT